MPEKKRKTYYGYTEAKKECNKRYLTESVDTIKLRVPKGQKDQLKELAARNGESLNAFIVRCVNETIERDQ